MEGLIHESTPRNSDTNSKILSFVPLEFRHVGIWRAHNRAPLERLRAGCQYFNVNAPREEGIEIREEKSMRSGTGGRILWI